MRKELYLAGGCFWGLEAYLDRIEGVLEATSGYANGHTANPTYQDVCNKNTGHAETVHIAYDSEILNLNSLLQYYFRVIDPTSINRQGNDIGSQYRTGIYYVNSEDKKIIEDFIQSIQNNYSKNIVVEVQPLSNFFKAEEYHQKYLKKNPQGYCHIDLSLADMPLEKAVFQKPSDEKLKKELSSLQYNVTQNGATEPPFQNPYWNHFEKGIYVDITTKEPLFVSTDKFHSNCGWPSFSKPIDKETVKYHSDHSHGMERTEVKSSTGDAHLGHVFPDGPAQTGGLRYCINSASLEFIPLSEMEEKGYGAFIHLID